MNKSARLERASTSEESEGLRSKITGEISVNRAPPRHFANEHVTGGRGRDTLLWLSGAERAARTMYSLSVIGDVWV